MSDFNNHVPMTDLAVTTAQTWMMRKSFLKVLKSKKLHYEEVFFTSTIFLANFESVWTPNVMHGWKALKVRIVLVPW